ncbi:MAG: FAD-dependent oxidoreductase, partial [Caulobacterales bacterium]
MRILVIGGGVIGLSVAHRLMQRGATVALVEASRPSASLAAAGMLPPALEALEATSAHPDLSALLTA